jgi:alanine racemase
MLAVANVAEAAELRSAGLETPILLLGAYTRMECEDILDLDLAAAVSSVVFAEDLDRTAARRKVRAKVHIKVDTGMSRLGIPSAKAIEAITRISVLSNLALEGIFTHFACSDEEDKTFTMRQVNEFSRVIAALEGMGVRFVYQHAAASAACMEVPEAHFNCLRPGIALYGLHPACGCGAGVKLRPVMEFASRVVHVERHPAGATVGYGRTHKLAKDSALAVISAGYADGYDRRFSDKAVVTINGVEARVVGRVSMDLTSVDVTQVADVKVGDKAVLFSTNPKAPNSVENLARLIDTIPYTLTCGVSKRVERVYEG